jgi:hypothetical protein
MSAASLIAQGYGGYAGWGDAEADADFAATGGSGKYTVGTDSDTGETFAKDFLEAIAKPLEEETKFLEQYTADNPFVFDEELAKKSSEAEYVEHYTELLQDYVQGVDIKREDVREEGKLLGTLQQLDRESRTRSYERAAREASEGFSGSGLFYSGIKKRVLGEGEVDYRAGVAESETRFESGERGRERQLGTLDIAEERERRDIFGGDVERGGLARIVGGGEFQEAVQGGIRQREGERRKQYNVPLEQSYFRRFPSQENVLAGYTIPDYYT